MPWYMKFSNPIPFFGYPGRWHFHSKLGRFPGNVHAVGGEQFVPRDPTLIRKRIFQIFLYLVSWIFCECELGSLFWAHGCLSAIVKQVKFLLCFICWNESWKSYHFNLFLFSWGRFGSFMVFELPSNTCRRYNRYQCGLGQAKLAAESLES